eukprot:36082-Pelagomonas_calceolata.AAC.1
MHGLKSYDSAQLSLACFTAKHFVALPCSLFQERGAFPDQDTHPDRFETLQVSSEAPRAFCVCMAWSRLAELVKARVVLPGCLLWKYAVDKVLVRLVDSHPQ